MSSKVPVIKGDDLLVETVFYKWLLNQDSQGTDLSKFIPTIKMYTSNVVAPFKGRDDGQSHKYVFQAFWDNKNKANKLFKSMRADKEMLHLSDDDLWKAVAVYFKHSHILTEH